MLHEFHLNGNPTTYRNHAGTPVTLGFDAENRMTAFGTALTFGYNGDGLRAWKQAGTTKTWFMYDGTQPIIEMNGSGTVVATSLYGPTGLFARRANTTWVYHTFDPSGNLVSTNTNPLSGSIEGFDAYGNPSNPGIGTPYQYQGAWGSYTDSETGLVLQGHRFYDPATGRWLTRDPIGYAGGINLYGYVGGDPVNGSDPLGLDSLDDFLYWGSDFFGGWGDKLTFGGTTYVRRWMGTEEMVNHCSGAYRAGAFIGTIHRDYLVQNRLGWALTKTKSGNQMIEWWYKGADEADMSLRHELKSIWLSRPEAPVTLGNWRPWGAFSKEAISTAPTPWARLFNKHGSVLGAVTLETYMD